MYLSRLMFNPRDPAAVRALSDAYALHQLILSAFPHREDGGPGRVLFRTEASANCGAPQVLVQSEKEPGWSRLERALLLRIESKKVSIKVARGQRLRFRLRANPTVRRQALPATEGKPEAAHKRIGVYGEEAQRRWLDGKAEKHGFRVLESRVADRGFVLSHKPGQREPLRHLCVEFDGILEVTDSGRFSPALQTGIGSGKGFGFGLLSVARA
jgi:CRISPR system Cascade subunit CasE